MIIRKIDDPKTFDSELQRAENFGISGPDAEDLLSLKMRVCLVPVNPPPGKTSLPFKHSTGETFQAQRWNDSEWELFCSRYVYLTTEYWNGNYVLVPSPRVRTPNSPSSSPRAAVCGFNLTLVDKPWKAHHTITVVKLPPEAPKFRSQSDVYCSRDVWKEVMTGKTPIPNTPEVSWGHMTVLHEVGHLLGLGHPNERHTADSNDAMAYGSTILERIGVMGTGAVQKLYYCTPWQNRIARHTQTLPTDWLPAFRGDSESKGKDWIVKAG